MPEERRMLIHFTDGTEMQFMFEEMETDLTEAIDLIEKSLASDKLVLEMEGACYVFPYSSIKHIRISPSPKILPNITIPGLRLITS